MAPVRLLLAISLITLLCSCAKQHQITIELRGGSVQDYSLVSIRDSAIVVLPTYERTEPRYLAYTHMIVIPDTAIFRVQLPVSADFVASLPMMLIGATVGATLGKPCDCDNKLSDAVIGLAIGWNLDKVRLLFEALTNKWLFLWAPDDRAKIREDAIFREEPPIMKYVR